MIKWEKMYIDFFQISEILSAAVQSDLYVFTTVRFSSTGHFTGLRQCWRDASDWRSRMIRRQTSDIRSKFVWVCNTFSGLSV